MPAASPDAEAIRSITRRYYVVSAWYSAGPFLIMAVYPLFLRARSLDQFGINTVTTVFVLITFLTDVPTGAFADAVGRRAAVVAGSGLHAIAFLIYFLSHSFWFFVVAAAADGLGTTFGNGPIDAWAIDALDTAGFEGAKDRMFSRKFQIGQIVGMAITLAGAYAAEIDVSIPFIVNSLVWIGTGLVAAAMMGRSSGQSWSLRHVASEVRRRSIDSTLLGFADRNVRLLSIAGLLSAFLFVGWGQEWQQFFKRGLHSGIGGVGWVSAAIILAQIAGLEIAARIPPQPWERRALLVAGLTGAGKAAIIIAGLAAAHVEVALASIMTFTFVMGIAGPMGFSWYNEVIEGENRATLLSFATTMSTLGAIIGLPVQGKLVDLFGTGITWQIAGLISMASVVCYLAVRKRKPGFDSLEPALP